MPNTLRARFRVPFFNVSSAQFSGREITREQELHLLTQLWMRNTAHNPVLAEGHD